MTEPSARRYFVSTFGCRVNQADSAGLAAELEAGGFSRAKSPKQAEVVVLNTCTVTHRSDADVRKAVARLQREAPGAKVMVTGCFAQRAPEEAAAILGVSAVVGNAHKSRLPILARDVAEAPAPGAPTVHHSAMELYDGGSLPVEPTTTVLDRTRPFVKIQDGCDAHCTYCIIPEVRGRARGADPAKVIASMNTLIARGYFEIVLAGIHLGTYGFTEKDGREVGLEELLRRVLEVPGLGRLRLSCIEPMAFPTEVFRLAAEDGRIAPHFHLPLQAGSDRILKRMGRPYRSAAFVELLEEARRTLPHACLGTDVIVGFPGETEEDFQKTLEVVESSPLDYVHVFSYSDREGTPSTRLDAKVDPRHVKDRASRLIRLSEKKWAYRLDGQLGRVLPALVLEPDRRRPGWVRALTESFENVDVRSTELKPGAPVQLRILEHDGKRLVGALA